MKSEVYKLGVELGVIESIIKAKPTDGLFDDERTDEDQIEATYDEIEWAMKYFESKELSLSYTTEKITSRQKKVLGIYKKRHIANLHKTIPIPVFESYKFKK
jgi:NAD+ synthase